MTLTTSSITLSSLIHYCVMTLDASEKSGRECSCLSGHYGPSCDACVNGYFWNQERCVSCSCLKLCSNNQGHHQCYNCGFLLNDMLDVVKRKCSKCITVVYGHLITVKDLYDDCSLHHFNVGLFLGAGHKTLNHGDGTVAIVAVVVSLAFIGAVASGIYYYRYKSLNQAHNSLWSMELHEEKVSLNSACDYQRLDAAAINAKQDSTGKRSGTRPQSHSNKADGSHKYHCISI